MSAHPARSIAALHDIASGPGGVCGVVYGPSPGPFYAGLHRSPAATLLESVLTLLDARRYDEIILTAGAGTHLPPLHIGLLKLGVCRSIVSLKRVPVVGPVAEVSAPKPSGPDRFRTLSDRYRAQTTGAILVDATNMKWTDRLSKMFDKIEELCSSNQFGKKNIAGASQPAPRRLILIDAEFLNADRGLWRDEVTREQAVSTRMPARFAHLPEIIAGSTNDLLLMARNVDEARSVESSNLALVQLPKDAAKEAAEFNQFRIGWKQPQFFPIPGPNLGSAFPEFYPHPELSAYRHFRTVVPEKPKIFRPLPFEHISEDELFRRITRDVIGQDEAMRVIARSIVDRMATRSSHDMRPIATFLLPGPTGSGKTETAEALARALFGRIVPGTNVHKITGANLSFDASPLLGVPAGYVGFPTDAHGGGLLTSPLIRNPEMPCLFLFDEFEKAKEEASSYLLEIFDKGTATDTSSRHTVSFRNTIFVLTTNSAQAEFVDLDDRGVSFTEICSRAPDLLFAAHNVKFRREFLGRLSGRILPLCYPSRENTVRIARKLTERTIESAGHHLKDVSEVFLQDVVDSYQRTGGIRALIVVIEDRLKRSLTGLNTTVHKRGLSLSVDAAGAIQQSIEEEGHALIAPGA